MAVHAGSNNYRKLAGYPGEKYICFCSCMVSGAFACDTHIGFKVVDRPFYGSPYFIERIPFR